MEDPRIRLRWADPEKTVLIYEFERGWRTEEYLAASSQAGAMMSEVQHRVHVINLMNRSSAPASIVAAFPRMIRSAPFSHPNMGAMVMVEMVAYTEFAAQTFGKVFMKLYSAESLEEALTLVKTL